MTELSASSAFGNTEHGPIGDPSLVSIELVPKRPALSLRIDRITAEVAELAAAISGVPLPLSANTSTGDSRRWLWLGPAEWLLLDDHGLDGISHRLSTALEGAPAVVSQLDSSFAPIILRGPAARDVLAKGCPLDLHPRRFTVGTCVRTLVEQVRVILLLRRDDPIYELYADVSVARHFAAWLFDAAGEHLIPPNLHRDRSR